MSYKALTEKWEIRGTENPETWEILGLSSRLRIAHVFGEYEIAETIVDRHNRKLEIDSGL